MVDRSLASGLTVEGTFDPDQLYAGEADIVTTQGVVAAAAAAMVQYLVVALVGGYLIPYDKENGVAGSNVPYGVLPHAIPDAAVDQDTPVIIGGVLNFDILVADGQTYAGLQKAFADANSNIVIQKLY
jgi:hypothetical protein